MIFGLAVFCLALSGMAGLAYEIVWARYLALFLGHTSYAVVVVLVAFMGGLALGNAWLGALADRTRRPLALYAWLEIGIAAYALSFPFFYDFASDLYLRLAQRLEPGGTLLLMWKFVMSLVTIIVPTVLMGGTLPVLTRLVTRSLGELRERVAMLYFVNSAGAVLGCCLADFWWIPSWGLQATVWAGAAMNLLAGGAALLTSGYLEEGLVTESPSLPPVPSENEEQYTAAELRLAIWCIGLSGFVAMLYEVAWTRILALSLGSSTRAFSLMLITFISGIAVGAWWVGRWHRLRRTLDAFGWAELSLALALLISMFFYEYLPYWFLCLTALLNRRPETFWLHGMLQGMFCFLVMLIPTVCLGITLPLASRVATAQLARTGRSVGMVFSINTLGTVLGAAVTGLFLMPWFGLARTLALGIAFNATIGLLILGRRRLVTDRPMAFLVPLGVLACMWAVGSGFNDAWCRAFTLGLWREPSATTSLADYRARIKNNQLKYYCDGATATVSVHAYELDTGPVLALRVNGKVDAASHGDNLTQLLLGHIPMLLHPNPRQALVIGLGSGMTCGAVLRHPTAEHLDTVEISQEVAQAARLFGPVNDHVLDNPRLRLLIEDAKSFLQVMPKKYDVIISEPSNPWMAGVSGVFSREFYENCAARLNVGGLVVQWVQIYESNARMLQIVLATFSSVFPNVNIWRGAADDIILVGSLAPNPVNLDTVQQRFQLPSIRADFDRMDLVGFPTFLSQEVVSQDNGLFLPPPRTPLHDDYFPTLEYVAQKAFFVQEGTDFVARYNENATPRPITLLGRYLEKTPLTETDYERFAQFYFAHGLPDVPFFQTLLARWHRDFPASIRPVELSAMLANPQPAAELQALRMAANHAAIMQAAGPDLRVVQYYAKYLMLSYAAERSCVFLPPTTELQLVLEKLVTADAPNRRVHQLRLAELAWDRGDDATLFQLGRVALDPSTAATNPVQFTLDSKAPARVLTRMIESLWRQRQIVEAYELCLQAATNGYAGPRSRARDPGLEVVCRKVEAAAAAASVAGKP